MSHVTAVKCFVTDLDVLAAVAPRIGLEFRRDQTTWEWFNRDMGDSDLAGNHDRSRFGTGDHALRRIGHQHGDYEIGVVKRVDGQPGWELLYDAWGPGRKLEEVAGKKLATLKNELAAEVSLRIMKRKGYRVARTVDQQGALVLTCVK